MCVMVQVKTKRNSRLQRKMPKKNCLTIVLSQTTTLELLDKFYKKNDDSYTKTE